MLVAFDDRYPGQAKIQIFAGEQDDMLVFIHYIYLHVVYIVTREKSNLNQSEEVNIVDDVLIENGVAPMRIDSCKIVEVIKIEYIKGEGTKEDPIRNVEEYRTLDGYVIARIIP